MDKATLQDLQQMAAQYKKLAKFLDLSLTDTLLLVVARELIILNLKLKEPMNPFERIEVEDNKEN